MAKRKSNKQLIREQQEALRDMIAILQEAVAQGVKLPRKVGSRLRATFEEVRAMIEELFATKNHQKKED